MCSFCNTKRQIYYDDDDDDIHIGDYIIHIETWHWLGLNLWVFHVWAEHLWIW